MVSSKSSNKWKRNFPHHKQRLYVNLNIFHKNTKNLSVFWLITNNNCGIIINPVQFFRKNDYKYLNSMNPFLLSLAIYFVGSQFKLLKMSWYKCMTPFRDKISISNKNIFVHFMIHSLLLTINQMNNY